MAQQPRPSSVDDCNAHLSQREAPDTKSPKRLPASQLPATPCLSGCNNFLQSPGQKDISVKTTFLKVVLRPMLLCLEVSQSKEGPSNASPARVVLCVKGKTKRAGLMERAQHCAWLPNPTLLRGRLFFIQNLLLKHPGTVQTSAWAKLLSVLGPASQSWINSISPYAADSASQSRQDLCSVLMFSLLFSSPSCRLPLLLKIPQQILVD